MEDLIRSKSAKKENISIQIEQNRATFFVGGEVRRENVPQTGLAYLTLYRPAMPLGHRTKYF